MREQPLLIAAGSLVPGDDVPSDEKLVDVGKLPDHSAAAICDRLAGAESPVLAKPPAQSVVGPAGLTRVSLADVEYLGAIDPFGFQAGLGHRRVLTLEEACGAWMN